MSFCKEEVIQNQSVFVSEYYNVLLDFEPNEFMGIYW